MDEKQGFEPIRIECLIEEEVGKPRAGGGPGSALYAVPFRLTRQPPDGWTTQFLEAWRHPLSYGPMHRPKIARVVADKIILDGTSIAEIEQFHQDTLRQAVDQANQRYIEATAREEEERKRRDRVEREREEKHRQEIAEAAKRIRFD